MKKIFIGALVGTFIYFGFQTTMWMGGFNSNFSSYSPNQGAILECLDNNLSESGLYMLPYGDPESPDFNEMNEELNQKYLGKPWAMLFYHQEMKDFSGVTMLHGTFYSFLMCLLASFILYFGSFITFGMRFLVSMGISIFSLIYGPLSDLLWWEFPMNFLKSGIMDLTIGWGLVSLWLAYFVKKT